MIKTISNAALERPTKKQYDSLLNDYIQFCDVFSKDTLSPSIRKVKEYSCYLHYYLNVLHGVAEKRSTALGHFWLINGHDWDRQKYPTLRTMMRC